MFESIILFIVLIIGYKVNLKKSLKTIKFINLSLDFIVISIILLLGYNFSIFTHTNTVILKVLGLSTAYTITIFIMNTLGLIIYCKCSPKIKIEYIEIANNSTNNIVLTILKASKYLIYLVIGYILGEIFNIDITDTINSIVFIMLLSLMLIIGVLLRFENISLKSLFKNKVALTIVIVIFLSSILSAIIISLIANIPIKESIMICSGLGWYSLSVVLNTDFLGEYYGMVTFLVDFSREIIVIALIPMLKRALSVELIGYAANTAMDFCLPVIRNNYGTKSIPLAISVGLIFTIITPVLLVLENLIL